MRSLRFPACDVVPAWASDRTAGPRRRLHNAAAGWVRVRACRAGAARLPRHRLGSLRDGPSQATESEPTTAANRGALGQAPWMCVPNRCSAVARLVVGIANQHSIAYGCARVFRNCGADLAVTWVNARTRPYVEPLARELSAPIMMPLDVEQGGAMEAVFDAIRERWGRLDFILHSISFAPPRELHGRVADSSPGGFSAGDGYLLPFVHAHGAPGRTADEQRWNAAHGELRWCERGRAARIGRRCCRT